MLLSFGLLGFLAHYLFGLQSHLLISYEKLMSALRLLQKSNDCFLIGCIEQMAAPLIGQGISGACLIYLLNICTSSSFSYFSLTV